MILTIVEGSSLEFQTKKQKKDHFRLVNNVAVQGLVRYTDWSKTPLTFSEQDLNLESYPHTNALVIKENIAAWEVNGYWLIQGVQQILSLSMPSIK